MAAKPGLFVLITANCKANAGVEEKSRKDSSRFCLSTGKCMDNKFSGVDFVSWTSDMSINFLKPKVSLNILVLTSYQKLGQVDVSLRVLSFQNADQKLDIKFRLLEFILAIYNFSGCQFI